MSRRGPLSRMTLPAATVAAWLLAVALPAPIATGEERSWDSYRILTDRNIFRRDRRRPRPPVTTTAVRVRPDDSDRRLVLTGIAATDAEPVAFFENTRTGETVKVSVGETVGKGALKAILLEAVEYEREGTTRRIGFGRSLAGTADAVLIRREPPVRPVAPAPTTSDANKPTTEPSEATTQPSDEPPAPPRGDSNLSDIEEQMRRRREQELRR